MLVELLQAEKEKLKNEMNIQQDKLNIQVQKSKDLQRDLQGRAPIIFRQKTLPVLARSRPVMGQGWEWSPWTPILVPEFLKEPILACWKTTNMSQI